ncbi:hypothetical protein KAX02_08325 [candidate division WOR-3 bacterium]|nr:hypothetical protein [candidate division WOR-3 bacterium]
MKRLFLILGICFVLTISALAIPQAGKRRIRILQRIDNKSRVAQELIFTYFKGYLEIDGIHIILTQAQKDSLKVEYNRVIHYLRDSIPYDSLFVAE